MGQSKRAESKRMPKDEYEPALRALQIELVKLQREVIARGVPLLVLLEGRDTAGKDGAIRRLIAHTSPRDTRVFAPGVPTDRDRRSWYFQRFVSELPAGGELVVFNRSWYNRAGVEPVMGYCTKDESEAFLDDVLPFERLLMKSGLQLVKLYLDLSRDEQRRRLESRREDPLKQWKISPVDERAQELWDAYSRARDRMLARTHAQDSPWTVVPADDKRACRLAVLRCVLRSIDYPERDDELLGQDLAFAYDDDGATRLAP